MGQQEQWNLWGLWGRLLCWPQNSPFQWVFEQLETSKTTIPRFIDHGNAENNRNSIEFMGQPIVAKVGLVEALGPAPPPPLL